MSRRIVARGNLRIKRNIKRLLTSRSNKMMLFVVIVLSALSTLAGLYTAYAISPVITIIEQE